jgi:hypothetical protein
MATVKTTRQQRIDSQLAQTGQAAYVAPTERVLPKEVTAVEAVKTSKPSPTSVTGQGKTNNNNSISGSTPTVAQTTPSLSSGSAYGAEKSPYTTQAAVDAQKAKQNTVATQPTIDNPQNEGSWITTKTPIKTPTSPTGDKSTGTDGTTPATPEMEAGEKELRAGVDEFEKGSNAIVADLEQWKAEDIESITREYEARKAELDNSLNMLNTLHEQNLAQIDTATAASNQANEAALRKMEANTELAKQQVNQKYLELKAAQTLENKRAEIKKETALGVLGGSFTTAGAADIEDTIMQGDKALQSLGLSNISQNVQFTNDLNAFYDDYRTKSLEIQNYKMTKINESYASLQASIASIQASKTMSDVEKEQAIRQSGQYYNTQITNINKEIVQAKYDLSKNVVARADELKAAAEAASKLESEAQNKVRDDARATLTTLLTNYGSSAFTNLTGADAVTIKDLAEKAGWPIDKITSGIASMKEELNDAKINQMNITTDQKQQLIDLKAKLGTKVTQTTNADGTVSIIYSDPITKKSVVFNAGDIGTPAFKYQVVPRADGTDFDLVDKISGKKVVEGAGPKGTPADALNVPDGSSGGQCGRFVNNYSAGHMMGDSYESKTEDINSDSPSVGAIFVMPYKKSGHTGFVKEVGTNPNTGKPGVLVKDSNWSLDEKVKTHWIDQSAITGYITTSSGAETPEPTPAAEPAKSTPKVSTGISLVDKLINGLISGNKPANEAPEDPSELSPSDIKKLISSWDGQSANPKGQAFWNTASQKVLNSEYARLRKEMINKSRTSEAKATKSEQEVEAELDNLFANWET